jgi:alkylation response protein AidB-like acyl-CoA dehydrogenase
MITVEEFRERARRWVRETGRDLVAETAGEEPGSEEHAVRRAQRFQQALANAGLVGATTPKRHGGQGLTDEHRQALDEELAAVGVPSSGVFNIGVGMCVPTILEHGTESQRELYLPALLEGRELWCQLFSEPGAGSDLAGVQTRAVRDGNGWLLNGQKVWTSGAHFADFGMAVTRTDPSVPKHRGITVFLVDMTLPGVTTRPIRQINGDADFNEVFLDDVRVPDEAVLGEVGGGWAVVRTMLMNERVSIGAADSGPQPGVGDIAEFVAAARARGRSTDHATRQRVAELHVRQLVHRSIGWRVRRALDAGDEPGPEGSVAKLSDALLADLVADVSIDVAGPAGVAWSDEDPMRDRWARNVLVAPAAAIAGGTDQVQRNIIGERVLGLPREPAADRDVPFNELRIGTQADEA